MGILAGRLAMLCLIYISYLRYSMTSFRFELMSIIVGCGSLLSIYFSKIDYHKTISYKIIKLFQENIGISYSYNMGNRIASTFFHPNYYGYMIIGIILLSIYMILKNIIKFKPINLLKILFYTFILLANASMIFASKSRLMFLALFIGILILFIALNLIIGSITSIGICSIIYLNFNKIIAILPRFDSLDSGTKVRMRLWATSFENIKQDFISGKGYYSMLQTYQNVSTIYDIHIHNIFIEVLLSFGLIGTMMLVTFIILTSYKPLSTWLNNQNTYVPLALSFLVMTLIHGFTDVIILLPQTFILLGFVWSCLEVDYASNW